MQRSLNEVEHALKQTQIKNDPDYATFRSKTSKLSVLGHRLPVMQTLVAKDFSFYTKSQDEILNIWNHIWNTTKFHEAMSLPLFYYRHHKQTFGKKEWDVMKHWIDRIENWEHSDALSCLFSYFLERDPAMVLPTLKKWNQSQNPWKQRASIVPLIYYASPKRKAPPVKLILEMIEPLIKSKNKYVNKAVGWTLRESYKLYPKQTLAFIKQHLQNLSADSFSYATEKLDKQTKQALKSTRTLARRR